MVQEKCFFTYFIRKSDIVFQLWGYGVEQELEIINLSKKYNEKQKRDFFCRQGKIVGLIGKKNLKKRYLWGLGVGVLYCLFFGVIRVGMGQAFVTDTTAFFTMMLYCAAGGMLGGMLS